MNKLVLVIFLVLPAPFYGQLSLPPIADSEAMGHEQLCTPGIINKSRSRGLEITYNYTRGGALKGQAIEDGILSEGLRLKSFESINFKLKIPLVNRPDFKLLVGYSHLPETYRFAEPSLLKSNGTFEDVHTQRLQSNGFGVYMIRPISADRYTALRIKMNYNGDYSGWMNTSGRYGAFSATWAYGLKKSEDFEWGFGLGVNHNFRRTLALPFVFYNRNFNDKWGVEAVFPAVFDVRYNFNPKSILLAGYQFNSRSYSVDARGPQSDIESIYHLNHSEIQWGVSLEQQIVPWIWFNIKAGYQMNLNTRLESSLDPGEIYRVRPVNAPYFRVGLFLSPPDKFCK